MSPLVALLLLLTRIWKLWGNSNRGKSERNEDRTFLSVWKVLECEWYVFVILKPFLGHFENTNMTTFKSNQSLELCDFISVPIVFLRLRSRISSSRYQEGGKRPPVRKSNRGTEGSSHRLDLGSSRPAPS